MAFYALCCAYLWLSAKQLRDGLPLIVREHPLTDSSSRVNLYLYKAYMAIPFLWEIRSIMDWTVERTSLDLTSYLQLEDVYAGLCLVRANLYWRRFVKGRPQPPFNRATQGCGWEQERPAQASGCRHCHRRCC